MEDKLKVPEDSESDYSDKSKNVSGSPLLVQETISTRGSLDNASGEITPPKKEEKPISEEKVEEPEEVNFREMPSG